MNCGVYGTNSSHDSGSVLQLPQNEDELTNQILDASLSQKSERAQDLGLQVYLRFSESLGWPSRPKP